MFARREKVTIIYKNGERARFKAEELTVHTSGGRLSRLSWSGAKRGPLYVGVDDIAAVYNGWHR